MKNNETVKYIKRNININTESDEICPDDSSHTLAATSLNQNDDSSTSNSQLSGDSKDCVELDVRNLPNSSSSGYETKSNRNSSSSEDIEEGARGFTNRAMCDTEICTISKSLEDHLLKLRGSISENMLTIPIADIPAIEAKHNIELKKYTQYSTNLDSNHRVFMPCDNCSEAEKIKFSSIIKQYYSEKWMTLIPTVLSHLSATAILTSFKFWNKWGLIPRLMGAVVGINVSGFLKYYLDDNNGFTKEHSEKIVKALKVFEKLLNIAIIGGTVVETAIFNFDKLSPAEQEEFTNNFLIIFSDEVFINYISKYFTVEQIMGGLHTVFAGINIFTKKNNIFTGSYSKLSDLTRAALVITGFGILTANVLNESIPLKVDNSKYYVVAGIQSACLGAYIWLGYILKDIKDSVVKYLNK